MENLKIGKSLRIFLLVVSIIVWVGIWHTGFNIASWILYLIAIFLSFAAITGICPGLFLSKLVSGELKPKTEE